MESADDEDDNPLALPVSKEGDEPFAVSTAVVESNESLANEAAWRRARR